MDAGTKIFMYKNSATVLNGQFHFLLAFNNNNSAVITSLNGFLSNNYISVT